jgi:hypothetical protein
MSHIKLYTVTSAPTLTNPHIQRGITSAEAAKRWAQRLNASEVYWFQKREQAYCPRFVLLAKPEAATASAPEGQA